MRRLSAAGPKVLRLKSEMPTSAKSRQPSEAGTAKMATASSDERVRFAQVCSDSA